MRDDQCLSMAYQNIIQQWFSKQKLQHSKVCKEIMQLLWLAETAWSESAAGPALQTIQDPPVQLCRASVKSTDVRKAPAHSSVIFDMGRAVSKTISEAVICPTVSHCSAGFVFFFFWRFLSPHFQARGRWSWSFLSDPNAEVNSWGSPSAVNLWSHTPPF